MYYNSHQINNLIQVLFYIKLGSNKCYFNYVVYIMKCGIMVFLYYHTKHLFLKLCDPPPFTVTHTQQAILHDCSGNRTFRKCYKSNECQPTKKENQVIS